MEAPKSKFLKDAIQACKTAFWYVALFSCVVNILMLTVSIYMLQIFDRVFASHNYATLLYLTIIAVFALAILSVLDFVRSRILLFVSHWLDHKLSPEALHRSVENLLQGNTYAAQSLRDIAQVRGFLSGPGMLTIMDAPWVPVYLAVIFMLHPILGLLGTGGAIILALLAVINERITRPFVTTMNESSIKAQYHITSALRNAESIQAMGMLPEITQRWFTENEGVLKLHKQSSLRGGIIMAISKFFRFAIQILILGIGAYLVVTNRLTSGAMIAASIVLSRALAPIEQSIGVWNQFLTARQAYHRLEEYFQKPMLRTSDIDLPRPKGHIVVENVGFIPPNTLSYVVRGINFEAFPGEILAIIGPSAAGKTTLARLMVGVWPPSVGNVRLDGADVFTWERSHIGKFIGYLPQNIELFAGKVKDNIARLREEADDESVIQAAMDAGVHDLILHLPDGYDFIVKEGGQNLSGGQRQRIGLARAFFGKPQVLVLDEPNSNLDAEGELALMQSMIRAKERGMTVVFITHKPNIVQLADKILLLQHGAVQIYGGKNEVLAKLAEVAAASASTSTSKKEEGG